MRDIRIEEKIPAYIWNICHRFYEAGEDAYVVGGSLRDIMLGRTPSDFDLATSALPAKTAELFSDMRVIETGIKHGTVTVIADTHPVEITTFRIDGSYTDSRHPDGVCFTGRIEEDLMRRDFTVNAMAYNDRAGLVDPFGGRSDLKARTIRAVGDSEKRFSEDALRIMRAFRFSAQLDFSIDESTLSGAKKCRSGLENIARERISVEFLKLVTAPDPKEAIALMVESGVLPYVTGGYAPKKETVALLRAMTADADGRLGLFLSDTDGDTAREILRSLKYSNALTTGALSVRRGARRSITTPSDARRLIGECGIYAKNAALASSLLGNSSAEAPVWVEQNDAPCTLSSLAISGKDLISLGIGGKDIGRVLQLLLDRVINDPTLNQKQILLELAEKYR